MPLSCGHGTKRKVATPEPEPDVDTEEEEEEAAAGENNTGTDPTGYEEVASSYTKAKKACVDIINAVHKEYTYLQTCDKKERSRRKRKRFGAMPAPTATAPMLYPTRSRSQSS